MISQDSNNRPSGSPAILCDAGIPIVGRTSTTGVYEILKVNADGSLAGFPANVTSVDVSYISSANANSYPLNPALHAAGQLVAYVNVVTAAITEGLYRITPYYQVDCPFGAAVNFFIVKNGSAADVYLSTLAIGTDGYNPNVAQLDGVYSFYYNAIVQPVGSGTVSMAVNVLSQDVYLASGTYKVAVVAEAAFTNGSPTTTIGLQQFLKIA